MKTYEIQDGMVHIPVKDFNAIQERLEDLEDAAAIEAHLASPGEAIPAEYVERMLAGESPVKVFRSWRGYSQAVLSEKSGIDRAMIGMIETGKRQGSVETIKALAEALGVDMEDLV